MEDRIETRLSDGLQELKAGEADTVIIAGMGGELMLRILRDGAHMYDSVKHCALTPVGAFCVPARTGKTGDFHFGRADADG